MKSNLQICRTTFAALATLAAGLMPVAGFGGAADDGGAESSPAPGAVYTMSNAADGNAVLMFKRAPNGKLAAAGAFPTGGLGTGGGLGNGHGLVLSEDGRWLLAVNAGSNEVSVFATRRKGLRRTATVPSGGTRPVSVAVDDDLVYVLNAGSDSIAGFHLNRDGQLEALANATRPLSGTGTSPAEIDFSPDGRNLVVTEKATNQLLVYSVQTDGTPGQSPNIVPSAGPTPFGFAFAGRSELLVSEAGGGAGGSSVSGYRLFRDGQLGLIEGATPTQQTAACWIEVSPDRRYAYTANTPSASISGFRIDSKGDLTLLSENGVSAATGDGSNPIDLAFSRDGRFLYSLNSGTHAIGIFRASGNGGLRPVATTEGLPDGANGLAAR